MTAEVFADGIGGIRIAGDTARIDFVSLTGDGRFEPPCGSWSPSAAWAA